MRFYRMAFFASALLLVQPVVAQSAAPSEKTDPAAAAKTETAAPMVAVDKGAVNVPELPAGMCPLDPAQEADRNAISDMHIAAQGDYKLLAVSAECRQLKALRAGSGKITFLSQYATLIEQQNASVALNRGSTLLALSSAVGLTSAFSTQSTQSAQAEGAATGRTRPSYHGILKQTSDFLIVGAEQRHIMRGKEFSMAVVSLITVVKGEIVTANFFAPAVDAGTYTTLASQAEAYGNQLLAANP